MKKNNAFTEFLYIPNIKQIGFPLLFSLAFVLCMVTFNVTMQIIVQQSVMKRNHHLQPSILYDPIHEITTDLSKYRDVIDYFIKFVVAVSVVSMIMQKLKQFLNIFKRLCIILGVFYFLRGVTIFIFQIGSSPDPYCPKNVLEPGLSSYIRNFFLVVTLQTETCFDLFFSGHTGILTIFPLFWFYYSSKRLHEKVRVYAQAIYGLISLIGMSLVVLCRLHYTVDVVYSFWISVIIFFVYHDIIWHVKDRAIRENLTSMKEAYDSLKTEHFLNRWLFLFFYWLEYFNLKINVNKTIDDIV